MAASTLTRTPSNQDSTVFPSVTLLDSSLAATELDNLIRSDALDAYGRGRGEDLYCPSLFDIVAPTDAEGWVRWQSGLGLQATGHIRVMLVGDSALCGPLQRGWVVPDHEAVCDKSTNAAIAVQIGTIDLAIPPSPPTAPLVSTFQCHHPFYFWDGLACRKTTECQIELVAPTSVSDRVCTPVPTCGTTSFRCEDNGCCPLTRCRRGSEYSPIGPTATTDRVCVSTTTSCRHPNHRVLQHDAPRGSTVYSDGCRPCPQGTTTWHTLENPHSSRACLNTSFVGMRYASRGLTWFDSAAHEADR